MKTLFLFLFASAVLAAPTILFCRKKLPVRKTFLYGVLSTGIVHYLVFMYWREKNAADLPNDRLIAPHDVAVADDSTLYVCEWLTHGRIQKLVIDKY